MLAEAWGGGAAPVSLELLGKARELASALGGEVGAVVLNRADMAKELIAGGADRVYVLEHPALDFRLALTATAALAWLVRERRPEAVLAGATSFGTDLAARLAARLRTGLTAHCIDLYIEEVEGRKQLVQVVPGWGGNLALRILCPERRPAMATVKPGVLEKSAPQVHHQGEVIRLTPPVEADQRLQLLDAVEEPKGEAGLEEAGVVVAGGWGLFCAGGFDQAQHLCSLLGGAMAGTRPTVDKGLLPPERMLGHSGKTVSPKLLMSLGASGAVHFTSGFLRAKAVLAIDQNPQAPIFGACDVGIVGDLKEVLPLLVEEIEERLQK